MLKRQYRHQVSPMGGITTVMISNPDGFIAEGKAECSSKDNYCKKMGVHIALGRAMKKFDLATELQADIAEAKEIDCGQV